MNEEKAVLALADGTIFRGKSIGASGRANGEIVFNTSMTGYQEILTDPSYSKQIVTLTYPHIGNTGTNKEDIESGNIWCSGLVIRSNSLLASNWRSENSLTEYLKTNNILGISDIDTRKLTRLIRTKGAQSASIVESENIDEEEAVEEARKFEGLAGMDLAQKVCSLSLGLRKKESIKVRQPLEKILIPSLKVFSLLEDPSGLGLYKHSNSPTLNPCSRA